jgi:hypothetical protein
VVLRHRLSAVLPFSSSFNNRKAFGKLPKAWLPGTITFGNPAVMAFYGFRPVVLRHRLSAVLPFRGAIETIV